MAIITCRECNKDYSDKAAACPHCGCPTEYNLNNDSQHNDSLKKKIKKRLIVVAIIIIGLAGLNIGVINYQQKQEAERLTAEHVYKAVAYDICVDYLFQQTISEDTLMQVYDELENPTRFAVYAFQGLLESNKHELLRAENELRVNIINELNSALSTSEEKESISMIETYQKSLKKQYESNKTSLLEYEEIFWRFGNAIDEKNYTDMGKYENQLQLTNGKMLYGENDLENYIARQKLLGYIDKHNAGIDENAISNITFSVKDDIAKKIKINDTPELNVKKAQLIGSLKEYHININQELTAAE
ncbi:MAG: hypothetical protein PHV95_09100 [Eubacteriales bacterium]|nr:hypothetical protein [Eubacteriales bacterium]